MEQHLSPPRRSAANRSFSVSHLTRHPVPHSSAGVSWMSQCLFIFMISGRILVLRTENGKNISASVVLNDFAQGVLDLIRAGTSPKRLAEDGAKPLRLITREER